MTLFDKNGWLGGKAAVLEEGGFRFDMGPTILTVPRVLGASSRRPGARSRTGWICVRLDPQWRCFFDDGTRIDLVADVERMAGRWTASRRAPGAGDGYRRFQDLSRHLHEVSERFFFWKPVEDMLDTFDLKANLNPGTLRDVMSLRMGSSVAGTIRAKVKDARLAQMLDHFTQYVGSSPYGSPAVCAPSPTCRWPRGLVPDRRHARGGDGAAPARRRARGASSGSARRSPASRRGRCRRRAHGDGDEEPVDAVVSNMDAIRTYRELVGGAAAGATSARATSRPARASCSTSASTSATSTSRTTTSSSRATRRRSSTGSTSAASRPRPDLLRRRALRHRPERRAAGGEALYVLVHTPLPAAAPRLAAMFPAYRRVILDKLKRTAGCRTSRSGSWSSGT